MQKNCTETAEVTTYKAIDGPLTPRRFVSGHRRMKEKIFNEDWGILTKCGDTEDLDGPLSPRRTVLHIHHCQQKVAPVPILK
ncbi:hypothetical protein EJD97_025821 [Solanum chilense]|uniref:Uncharacterized protein n=1 Tax=Solanum chilense TaxID=4083 RepID=A0A6N2ANP0_SOLCI|nr:hypothetical protein EJD97_025821 [Solanum chilense]